MWCFIGDGETDEPETLAAIRLAAREHLDNLVFVVNGNLQRLDGPVRGNSRILDELEGIFAGAGWHVLKVLWGTEWRGLFSAPGGTALLDRLEAMNDGDLQRLTILDARRAARDAVRRRRPGTGGAWIHAHRRRS